MTQRSILLIISGGIAAYKSLELIRLLRAQGTKVSCILTTQAENFVTPLTVATLSEERVYQDRGGLEEGRIEHIHLSRQADLIVIAPATANILAKMAGGIADDLATTVLLGSNKPILAVPAMNPTMWSHPATEQAVDVLKQRGVSILEPVSGDTACHEVGIGRMAEPETILDAIMERFFIPLSSLRGRTALVTSGPTYEAIDPIRFIGNRSSGRQGHAIAQTLERYGVHTTLVSGPTQRSDPPEVRVIHIQSAEQMLQACLESLPVDIVVCAAAVCDWRPQTVLPNKAKKKQSFRLTLVETPDILSILSQHPTSRAPLVVGFAAETDNILEYAQTKLKTKQCDWILANDVSLQTIGGPTNAIYFIQPDKTEFWPQTAKSAIAERLVAEISRYFT